MEFVVAVAEASNVYATILVSASTVILAVDLETAAPPNSEKLSKTPTILSPSSSSVSKVSE